MNLSNDPGPIRSERGHRVGIDIGGTFTDVVVLTAQGRVEVLKLPSTPPTYEDAILDAVGQLDEIGHAPERMSPLAHGTTVATNAVLEHRGARVVLVTTEGFRDVLELGQMRRPTLVDPAFQKPSPVVPRRDRIEARERIGADGTVVVPLDLDSLGDHWGHIGEADAVAVCFIHSYINPSHERALRDEIEERFPGKPVSLSSDVLPELGEYERLSTTVVNAYVQPVIGNYVETLSAKLGELGAPSEVFIMQSNGALCDGQSAARRPVTIMESGPAAGVTAAAALADRIGLGDILTFDMGGTTAKASLVEDGAPLEATKYEVGGGMNGGRLLSAGAGYVVGAPSIDIAEVGAGGGSQFWIDGAGHPQVGPESSGAVPGPVCYGRGGTQVTVTDANLILGYLSPEGLAGNSRAVSSVSALDAISVQAAGPLGITADEAAYGIYQVANAAMVRALRAVSTERGRDPRDFTLVAFGGSGPMHAVALAQDLDVKRVVVPRRAGLFSAVGLLDAPVRRDFMTPWLTRFDARRLEAEYDTLTQRAEEAFKLSGSAGDQAGLQAERFIDLRYLGQQNYLTLQTASGEISEAWFEDLRKQFDDEYERTYGHSMPDDALEIVNLRIRATLLQDHHLESVSTVDVPASDAATADGLAFRDAYFGTEHGRIRTRVVRRTGLGSSVHVGPLLIDDMDTTTVIPPNCSVQLDEFGNLVIAVGQVTGATDLGSEDEVDVITKEVVRNGLTSLADEMAMTVVRTARSQIVRDTMDFSTGILDKNGHLVSLGLTLLLQLGSLPGVMETINKRFAGDINPEDVFVGNDPGEGGMHLPDVYLLKPVFENEELVAWSACIAQHADVGGLAAGSTSPAAKDAFQEGLQIPFTKFFDRGVINEPLKAVILRNSRVPDITWSDLCAQRAAIERGEAGIHKLIDRHGLDVVSKSMQDVLDSTEALVRSEVAKIPDGRYEFVDYLDDDGYGSGPLPIAVSITIDGEDCYADFEGSAPQVGAALNSTFSYTKACVCTALVWSFGRRENLINSGLFRAVTVTAPDATIVNGEYPAARGARGTTGFRIVDAVLGALHQAMPGRVPAAGEGGLAVVTFGGLHPTGEQVVFNDIYAAAWGGREGGDGVDGTSPLAANLASTPIEMIERYHPVRLERYGFMSDSGGPGRYRGGLALERRYTFLGRQGHLQVRSDRRDHQPYGLDGGHPGAPSVTTIFKPGADPELLPTKIMMNIETGTTISQVTPGSGGYGDPLTRLPDAVLADVLDEKVSVAKALELYGVDVDVETRSARRVRYVEDISASDV